MELNILLLIALFLLITISFMCKSRFESSTSSTTPKSEKTSSIQDDSVLIFYAPWCGHCKKSMKDFNEASDKGGGKVILINSDDPASKKVLEKYKVAGFPTIIKADGTAYKGPRTADSILNFAKS